MDLDKRISEFSTKTNTESIDSETDKSKEQDDDDIKDNRLQYTTASLVYRVKELTNTYPESISFLPFANSLKNSIFEHKITFFLNQEPIEYLFTTKIKVHKRSKILASDKFIVFIQGTNTKKVEAFFSIVNDRYWILLFWNILIILLVIGSSLTLITILKMLDAYQERVYLTNTK